MNLAVVLLGLIASIITIVVFISGNQSIHDFNPSITMFNQERTTSTTPANSQRKLPLGLGIYLEERLTRLPSVKSTLLLSRADGSSAEILSRRIDTGGVVWASVSIFDYIDYSVSEDQRFALVTLDGDRDSSIIIIDAQSGRFSSYSISNRSTWGNKVDIKNVSYVGDLLWKLYITNAHDIESHYLENDGIYQLKFDEDLFLTNVRSN